MITSGTTMVAIVAAIIAHFSPSVQACLELTGNTDNGPFTFNGGHITAVDNGVQTCDGDLTSGDNNVG